MQSEFPTSIRAGVTFDLTMLRKLYTAPTWALQVLMRGPSSIDIASAPDGERHHLLVDAVTTAAWLPGNYVFSLRAVSSGTIIELESGLVEVSPDLAEISPGTDQRNHIQRVLDSIEAVLEKRATQDQERYTINNRELWRTPIGDLLRLRDSYLAQLRRLKAAQRGTLFGKQVKVRF